MDFQKAFDSMTQNYFLCKLNSYVINNPMAIYVLRHSLLAGKRKSMFTMQPTNGSCCLLDSSIAKMWCLTSRESLEVLAADIVGR